MGVLSAVVLSKTLELAQPAPTESALCPQKEREINNLKSVSAVAFVTPSSKLAS